MSYIDKQINNILIKEGIYTTIGSHLTDFGYGMIDSILQKSLSSTFGSTSTKISQVSGWADLKTIGIFDPNKLYSALSGMEVHDIIDKGIRNSFLSTGFKLGFKTVQAAYLSLVGYFGVDVSEKVYNLVSENKELVEKSTDMG